MGDFLDVEVVFEPTSNRCNQWAKPFKGIDLCLDAKASARFKFGERRLNDSLGTLKGGLKCLATLGTQKAIGVFSFGSPTTLHFSFFSRRYSAAL